MIQKEHSDVYTYVMKNGRYIIERGVDSQGDSYIREESFKPYLFTDTDRESEYKSLTGKNLAKIEFEDCHGPYEYLNNYKDVDGHNIYGARDCVAQYISEYHANESNKNMSKIYGSILDIEVFSGHLENGNWVFDGFPKTELADKPINAITFYDTKHKLFRVYGLEVLENVNIGTYDNSFNDVIYQGFVEEISLLKAFLIDFTDANFHFISGWYVELFDIAYLTKRIINVLGQEEAKKLSPLRKIREKKIDGSYGNVNMTYKWVGMSTLDYIDLYKKLDGIYRPKNWKLNTVARDKLNDEKLPYEGPLQELYLKNYQEFINYNIHDVRLIVNLDEKEKFFELIYTLSHMMKSNVEDCFATVKPWTNLMYHSLRMENKFPLLRGVSALSYDYVGGFVKEPTLGKHKWIASFDLNSLYPSLMQQYNLGQESIVPFSELPQEIKEISNYFRIDRKIYTDMQSVQEKLDRNVEDIINKKIDLSPLKKYGYNMTGAGIIFSNKEETIFNSKTKEIYQERTIARKKLNELKRNKSKDYSLMSQLQNKQLSLKLMMNSLYGAVANEYFTEYYDIRVAEAITSSGQLAVQFVSDRLNKHLNQVCSTKNIDYVVYCDTDSVLGSSIINVNGKNISIEEYYKSVDNEFIKCDDKNLNYIKTVSKDSTLSVNKELKIEEKSIKYVMKHKVNKRMFKIIVNGKEVTVTEDHSIMVLRDGALISRKPKEIIKGDIIITYE